MADRDEWTALCFRRQGDRIVVLDPRGGMHVCTSEESLVEVVVGLVDSDLMPRHRIDTSLRARAEAAAGSALELVLPKAGAFAARPILRGLLGIKDEIGEIGKAVETPRKVKSKKKAVGVRITVDKSPPPPSKRPLACLRPGARGPR